MSTEFECFCCEGEDSKCKCKECHECDTCFGCLNCICIDHDIIDEKCECNSPSDCECEKCITTTKCPNYEFCKVKMPQSLLDTFRGRCRKCDINLGRNYIFIDSEESVSCMICMENKNKFVKMENCIHKICTGCFKEMLDTVIISNRCRETSTNINKCPYCRQGYGKPQWDKDEIHVN